MNINALNYERILEIVTFSCQSFISENKMKSMIDKKTYPKYGLSSFKGCGSVWDGWSCHQDTGFGQVNKVKCLPYINYDSCHTKLGESFFF